MGWKKGLLTLRRELYLTDMLVVPAESEIEYLGCRLLTDQLVRVFRYNGDVWEVPDYRGLEWQFHRTRP